MKAAIREIITTILLALLFFVAIRTVVHNFEVNGFSMEPNLHDGQFVIVSKAAYWFNDPQRGDIVVFQTNRLDHGIIHRIVGLPGELVELRNGILLINEQKLKEPYMQGYSISVSPRKIPYDNFFIVGDNRAATSWDIVPQRDIVGKAWLIYWPLRDWGMAPNHQWESETKGRQQLEARDVCPEYLLVVDVSRADAL